MAPRHYLLTCNREPGLGQSDHQDDRKQQRNAHKHRCEEAGSARPVMQVPGQPSRHNRNKNNIVDAQDNFEAFRVASASQVSGFVSIVFLSLMMPLSLRQGHIQVAPVLWFGPKTEGAESS